MQQGFYGVYLSGIKMVEVIKTKNVDGIELGVLADGTPFLTQGALAKFCGVTPKAISDWGRETPTLDSPFRFGKLAELLQAQGFNQEFLYESIIFNGQSTYVYPDSVCMAFLEYYAFEAPERKNKKEPDGADVAKKNYRVLARRTLKDFIYRLAGYDPENVIPLNWQHFHDRMLLNPVPVNYFSVFKETADIVIASIREGLKVDSHTVPDISVGMAWSKYWNANNLSKEYGERTRYPHVYPDYFPQSQANGEISPFVYPIEALGKFRVWLQSEYLPEKFPNYIKGKVRKGAIPASAAELLLNAVVPKQIE